MVGVGFGVLFFGYTLLTYGWSQLNHGNAGLISIVWPGAYQGNPLDTGSDNPHTLPPAKTKGKGPVGPEGPTSATGTAGSLSPGNLSTNPVTRQLFGAN